MLITIDTPVGIDQPIKDMQVRLHDKLVDFLGIESAQYKCYPRAYRNATDNGYIAEVYEGNSEYREVYFDDELSLISFFGISGVIEVGVQNSADIHLVFFANLDKVFPGSTYRKDEELRAKICDILKIGTISFGFGSIDIGVQKSLPEYPGSRRDDRLKYMDMHPHHVFRLNLTVNYENYKYC